MLIPNVKYYLEVKTGPKSPNNIIIAKYNGCDFIEEVSTFMGKEKIYRADEVMFVYFPVDRGEERAEFAKMEN